MMLRYPAHKIIDRRYSTGTYQSSVNYHRRNRSHLMPCYLGNIVDPINKNMPIKLSCRGPGVAESPTAFNTLCAQYLYVYLTHLTHLA